MTIKSFRTSLLIIFFIYLTVRLAYLGPDISNTDAYRWHRRSQNFLQALKSGDLKQTYQHYQPGVSLMWLNAAVKQSIFSFQYHIQKTPEPFTLENSDHFVYLHGISKAVLVLVLFGLFVFQIFAIKKLIGDKAAVTFGFLMSVEPYLVGIDRWFHLTSLEAYFGFSSVLALLIWHKSRKAGYFYVSALFFVLAFLSKITAVIVGLPLTVVIVSSLYLDMKSMAVHLLKYFSIVVLCSLVLFPAALVAPGYVLTSLINAVGTAVESEHYRAALNPLLKLFFYDLILIYKLAPLTLLAWLFSFTKLRAHLKDINFVAVVVYLITYYLSLTMAEKKIDRYSIALIIPILFMTSYYLSGVKAKVLKSFVSIHILIFTIITLVSFPLFSGYYSFLAGGARTALKVGVYDNSGEYLAQAARYLNEKGRDIRTFVPYGQASFLYYYNGNLQSKMSAQTDYVVFVLDQDRRVQENFGCSRLEKSFGSADLALVFIYRCENAQ